MVYLPFFVYRISFSLSCLRPTLGSRVVSCFSRPATKRDLSSVLYAYWFLGFFFPCLAFIFLVYHLALVSKPFFFFVRLFLRSLLLILALLSSRSHDRSGKKMFVTCLSSLSSQVSQSVNQLPNFFVPPLRTLIFFYSRSSTIVLNVILPNDVDIILFSFFSLSSLSSIFLLIYLSIDFHANVRPDC